MNIDASLFSLTFISKINIEPFYKFPKTHSKNGEQFYMAKPKLKKHHINRDWCKGCSICVELCPKKVLKLDNQDKVSALRPQDCICCRLCEFRCPDFAIEIETEE